MGKYKKTKVEDLQNLQCETCARLGRMSQQTGDCLILLTLSPDPYWQSYNECMPDTQYKLLRKVILDKSVLRQLQHKFGFYSVISSHFEFNRNGNLHAHCIVCINKHFANAEANLWTISKAYHKLIGQAYLSSKISADCRYIDDDLIYKYLNKENAYPSWHDDEAKTMLEEILENSRDLDSAFPKAL